MRSRNSLILLLLLIVGSVARADAHQLAKLAWLGGCWKSDTAEAGSVEHWLPLAGGSMLGVSRTVKQGKTVAHEFMQIRAQPDGTVVFDAQPSGQQAATFAMLRITDTEVVFENLQHDFPQRIVYAIEDGGKLKARIEGLRNGSLRIIPFPMTRVSCDGKEPLY